MLNSGKKHIMLSKKYWDNFYKKNGFNKPSNFAKFCLPYIKGEMIELGCGDGRDLNYFRQNKIDCCGIDIEYNGIDVSTWLHNPCPEYVYTRFFWHAIDRKLQLNILGWVKNWIFIEARTTLDKPKDLFGKHKRNLVDVGQLIQDLWDNGFEIQYFKKGRGLSKYKKENPHLIRIIANKPYKK